MPKIEVQKESTRTIILSIFKISSLLERMLRRDPAEWAASFVDVITTSSNPEVLKLSQQLGETVRLMMKIDSKSESYAGTLHTVTTNN